MDYRLYFVDRDGHVWSRADLECADDEHALEVARTRAGGQAAELWRRERRIAMFPATPGGASPS